MNAIQEFCAAYMTPLVVVFTVLNLFSMGLQVNIKTVIKKMSNVKALLLIFVWGWVVGPALGYLIITILPLAEPFAQVVLLTSLAPCAPFLPPMIEKAKGNADFAGVLIPLSAVGTVIFMPLVAPFMISGLTIDAMALAKPLIITVLIPLLIGAIIKTYAEKAAIKMFKPVKLLALLSTLLTVVFCFILYTEQMIETAGSFALLSMTLFMVGLGILTYKFGFGMGQAERSVMSLGMGTRNIAAVFAGVLAIPNGDPRMMAMVIMWTLWSVVLAAIGARVYGKKAEKLAAAS
jgi:BASS family bile acid:Na+ symporter